MKLLNIFNHSQPLICEAVNFIYDFAKKSKRNHGYKRGYRMLAKYLNEYEKKRGVKLMSNNFDYNTAEDYASFLKDKNLAKNTVWNYLGKTSYMFSRMSKSGYFVDFSYKDFELKKEQVNTVYLSTDEIERIYKLKIDTYERSVIRDRFVANCLTGFRYSDFSQLSRANINGKVIVRKTQKTGETVEVPIHRILKEIIKKYNGDFPPYDKSEQNYNVVIKKICKQAKINDKVLIERTKGHNVVRKSFKRYEIVSSHTARRSFATNAYLAGIPTARIMLITGHKTEQSFFKYIRIGKRENALTLSEHPFFQ